MQMANFPPKMMVVIALLSAACALKTQRVDGQQASGGPSRAPTETQRLEDVAHSLGPFSFGGQSFTVVLHEKFLPGSLDPKFAQSLAALEIRDAKDTRLYEKSFPYEIKDGEFKRPVAAFAQPLIGIGDTWLVAARKIGTTGWLASYTGLLISYRGLPITNGAPSDAGANGEAWQVFGIKDGILGLFDEPAHREILIGNSAPWIIVRRTTSIEVVPRAPSSDTFALRVWTGNFYVFVPVQVQWDKFKLALGQRCFLGNRDEVGCDMRAEAERKPADADVTFLRLFPGDEPNQGEAKHVVLKRNSQVQLLKCSAFVDWSANGDLLQIGFRDLWLKVRIDSSGEKEGWIHGAEDFAAAGWPTSEDGR